MRATQYLPDIVKLQNSFYDSYHHCLDHRVAKTQTIGEFLSKISSSMYYYTLPLKIMTWFLIEIICNEYTSRIESLTKAWALVGHDLKKQGKICDYQQLLYSYIFLFNSAQILLEVEHCLPAITRDTSIEYLIPTSTGAGALMTCLVDYLIRTHNNFLKFCHEITTESTKR